MRRHAGNSLLILLSFLFCSCSSVTPTGVPSVESTPIRVKPPSATATVVAIPTSTEQPLALSAYHRIGNGALQQVKWTEDGKYISIGTTVGVFLYDTNNFAQVNEFEVGQSVYYLAVHPSGEMISVGADKSNPEEITLWNVQTGKPVTTLRGDCGCVYTNVAFSPDGSLLAAGNNQGQVWIWEWVSGKIVQTLKFRRSSSDLFVRWIQFNTDGLSLAVGSGSENSAVEVFDITSGARLLSIHPNFWFLSDVKFNHDGTRLAIAGNVINEGGFIQQYKVKVFDSMTGYLLYEINLEGDSADFVLFNPDGNSLITGACKNFRANSDVCLKARVTEWSASDGTLIRVIKEYTSNLVAGDYSPDGQLFGVITRDTVPLFEILSLTSNQIIHSMEWFVGPSTPIVFSPDSKTAIWGEATGAIRSLDIATKNMISTWESGNDAVVNLAISANGSQVAAAGRYGVITLWDVQTGDVLQKVQTREGFQIYSVQFSPDNRWLVWTEEDLYRADENQVQIYDVEQKKMALTIPVTSFHAVISPDSSSLAIADADFNEIRWFEIQTGRLLKTFSIPATAHQVKFSADGTILVAGLSNTNILFWDLASGSLLRGFDAYPPSDFRSIPFALFPKSDFLVFSAGPIIKILDLTSDQLVLEQSHLIGGTGDLAISPNEKIMATSDLGSAGWLWQVDGISGN